MSILNPSRYLKGQMTSLEKRVLRFIKYHPGCTALDIRNNYVRSPRLEQVEEILDSLESKGFIACQDLNGQKSCYQIMSKVTKKDSLKEFIIS